MRRRRWIGSLFLMIAIALFLTQALWAGREMILAGGGPWNIARVVLALVGATSFGYLLFELRTSNNPRNAGRHRSKSRR